MSKVTIIMMGVIIIGIGLFINSLRHLSLFDIVLNVDIPNATGYVDS